MERWMDRQFVTLLVPTRGVYSIDGPDTGQRLIYSQKCKPYEQVWTQGFKLYL